MKDERTEDNKTELARWMAFHFGTLSDSETLRAERDLLADPEVLVNYFNLKRQLDQQVAVPKGPSLQLRARLVRGVNRHRRPLIGIAVGAALAASLAFVLTFKTMVKTTSPQGAPAPSQVSHLFDAADELPPSSSVL